MAENLDKILVTGSDGLVGSRFLEISKKRDYLHSPTQIEVDLTDAGSVHELFRNNTFRAVVNFAAYTDIDEAEKQRGDKNGSCYQVNVNGLRNLIEAIEPISQKTHFIQISTDMVFPGSDEMKGPYEEDDAPLLPSEKLTWYGFTKAEGERLILERLGETATILRLIYPVRAKYAKKLDFLRKALSLYDTGKLYPLFSDQVISISFIDQIVKVLDSIIEQKALGVYHASSADTGTPFEIVSYLLEKARNVKNVVQPASVDEYLKKTGMSSVRYPKYGGLAVKRTQANLGVKFSSWKEIVDKLVIQGITP